LFINIILNDIKIYKIISFEFKDNIRIRQEELDAKQKEIVENLDNVSLKDVKEFIKKD
jgi:hypothetical protein